MDGVEDDDAAVQHAQAPFNFDCEIDVAGGVDDIDAMIFPVRGGGGGGDGDAALPFLRHPVHDGGAFVHFAEFVGTAGVEEDAFGHGRLAGVDVGDDADVTYPFDWIVSRHLFCSPGKLKGLRIGGPLGSLYHR